MNSKSKYETLRERVAEKVQKLRRVICDTSESDEARKDARDKLAKYRSALVQQASLNGNGTS